MSRPMSPLERSLLYPDPKHLSAEKLAEMEAERCEVCTGLKGFWAGKLDMACTCPKPDNNGIPEKKIRYPYLPIPAFNFGDGEIILDDDKIREQPELTYAERLEIGQRMLDYSNKGR